MAQQPYPGPVRPPPPRERRWDELERRPPEVVVVGGGITGAGVALDLAARGLRTAVFERGDWACATSSASSRLIHGGLRYLEQFELALVRDSCLERGLLLRNAAGLVWPESFVFPLHRGGALGRARLAAGLGLYTLVSFPRVLGLPRLLSARSVRARVPGIRAVDLTGGGAYLDAATHDARLTLAVVLTAMEQGAIALSRTEVLAIENGSSGARVHVRDHSSDVARVFEARAVVLAGGPFTDALRARSALGGSAPWVRPTRGTHVLVPRERLPTDGAVIFPSPLDGRVMFLIPWPRFTVIGTTDLDASSTEPVRATREEVCYLLDSANGLVPRAELSEGDVVATYAGLRPLLAPETTAPPKRAREERPSERSREERLEREGAIFTLAGGKLTGFRSMAERLGARLTSELGLGRPGRISPTRRIALHGADSRPVARPAWSGLDRRGLPRSVSIRETWDRRYGALASAVEEACQRAEAGRSALDGETLLGEVDWAVRHEDCLTAEDFVLRRTDLFYGPATEVAGACDRVVERLAERLGWNGGRAARERAELLRALAAHQAWRGEPRKPFAARELEPS